MESKGRYAVYAVAVLVIVAVLAAGTWFYLYKYEDWQMARLSKAHPQGQELLTDYREAKNKLSEDPNNSDAYFTIGYVQAEFGQVGKAEKTLLKAVELDPENINLLNNVGGFYAFKKQDYPEAEKYYLRSLEIDPKSIATYYNLVGLYHQFYTEKKSEIENIVNKGLENLPGDQNLLALLASYYREIGDNAKAIEVYEKLLSLRPDDELLKNEIESLKGK